MKKQTFYIVAYLGVSLAFLSSCGVKPPHVDPPAGAQHSTFPNSYPDILTDPQPGLEFKEF